MADILQQALCRAIYSAVSVIIFSPVTLNACCCEPAVTVSQ